MNNKSGLIAGILLVLLPTLIYGGLAILNLPTIDRFNL